VTPSRFLPRLGILLFAASALLGAYPASAQDSPLADQDKSKPIEITADTLTVQQAKQLATFTGNVEAVQGDMTLKADILRVYYIQAEADKATGDAAKAAAPARNAPPAGDQGSIKRIEAEGNVFLSSPTDTAQGDTGVYDPIARKVTLDGNVILTRDDNVVKGASLDMDLDTGVSIVKAGPTAPGQKVQRVRALFVPQKKAQ
jgi:lipopolysaccharide export system protein LptA